MADGDYVILVEPSAADSRLIEDCLSLDGIEVLPASSLLEALLQQVATSSSGTTLDSSAREPVILYDTDAPENWREALQQFLRLRPGSRVVFLSRLADAHMWIEVLDTGGYDLVMKPLRAQEIRSVVRSALRRASGQAA